MGAGPRILLVHGWGGHAARLRRYVRPLNAAGFRVVAFDAPGHGGSGGGPVSLPEIADEAPGIGALPPSPEQSPTAHQ